MRGRFFCDFYGMVATFLVNLQRYILIILSMNSKKSLSHSSRVWWFVATGIIVVIIALLAFAGNYMLHYSLFPNMRHSHSLSWRLNNIIDQNPQLRPWVDSLKQAHALRDTFLVMRSGERHHATYIAAPRPTCRVAVVVHGYRDNGMGMMHIASIYNRMGYNVLLPDLHAHGKSQGEGIQMGWKDRLDVMQWMALADSLWGGAEGSQMVLHGISMGAATVMSVSGEKLPKYVRCFVEDCGYTSVWDEFSHELKEQFNLPPFPLLYTTSLQCQWRYGWSFGEASPLKQVSHCTLPMLFIHGSKDTYVPYAMLRQLYNAKPQPKAIWVAPGSIHAMSFTDHPIEYTRKVSKFVNRYIPAE